MSGYADTKKLIEDTLVGRPAGSLIYPEGHQAIDMSLLDYINSVELLGASELQGIATTLTVPVQPDNAKVSYIATVPAGQTYVFTNFHDQNGNSISITTGANTVSLLTFLWNGEYWQVQNSQIQLMLNITAGYLYAGIAIPTTNPGSPDEPVFYIAAQAGTYTNFDSIVVNDGEAAILKYVNSSWVKEVSGLATREEVSRLGQEVDGIRSELTGTQSVTGKIISYTSDILTNGKFVNRTTGEEGTSAYRSCTDFIPVTPGAEVSFNVCGGAASYIPSGYVFYDQNKNYVSGDGPTGANPIDVSLVVPAGAYFIRVTFVSSGNSLFSSFYYDYKESGEFDSVKREVDSLWDYNGKIVLYNGSNGNPANPNAVRSCVIPTNGAKYVAIKINRPNTAGCHYAFAYALTSDTRDIGSTSKVADWYGKIYAVDLYGNQTDAVIDISSFPTAVGIAITIGEFDSNNIVQTRRITDFDGYDVCVECSPLLEELIDKKLEIITFGSVVERNQEREIPLEAMCRYRKTNSPIKDAQFCICTDSHADALAVNNAVDATNGFDTIDGFIHCGDITASYYDTGQVASFQNSLNQLTKPGYIVIGNHDVGNANYVGICCDHAQAYAAYIKPMVDRGWLVPGEYTENKPYWFHDLATYKIRLIGLYEYDDAMDFNETYWRAITYNSGLSNIATNTAYSSGAQVNVPGYTAHSFEAVQAVTTPVNYYTTPEKFPSYKVRRGSRVIRQEQAEWYLNTLLGTPADYGVVVILHNPFADDAEVMDVKFSQEKSGVYGTSYSQNDMATDLIGGALAAFAAGSNYSENVAMKGDASYMNTQGGGTYAYSVSKNFASKNTGVKVFGLIGGHSHRDLVWRKGDIIQVTPICATTNIANATSGDIRRADTDGLTKDSLTIISFAAQRIGLVKIGVNVTDTGYARDFEVIPVNN